MGGRRIATDHFVERFVTGVRPLWRDTAGAAGKGGGDGQRRGGGRGWRLWNDSGSWVKWKQGVEVAGESLCVLLVEERIRRHTKINTVLRNSSLQQLLSYKPGNTTRRRSESCRRHYYSWPPSSERSWLPCAAGCEPLMRRRQVWWRSVRP